MAQGIGPGQAREQMGAADARRAVTQRSQHPSPLDRVVDVFGKVGHRSRPGRQAVQLSRQIGLQLGHVQPETARDPMQVAILGMQDLVHPMHQLDIGIAAQLAERGGALQRLVKQRIELSEKVDAADVRHGVMAHSRACGR
ncbi:hypothetical protein D9M70_547460 [compost metagenome]